MLQSVFGNVRRKLITLHTIRETYMHVRSKTCNKEPVCPSQIELKEPLACTNAAATHGRRDPELEKCLQGAMSNPIPPCTTKIFAAVPCDVKAPLRKKGGQQYIYKSAWENPQGCVIQLPCGVRHDISYLKPEPKCYQRTWSEFPARCKVKKTICKPEKLSVAQMEYRPRGQINKAATKAQPPIDLTNKCPKVRMPGCKSVRNNLKCMPTSANQCCKKRCTQYPSLSECCWKRPEQKKKIECGCLSSLSRCLVQEELSKGY